MFKTLFSKKDSIEKLSDLNDLSELASEEENQTVQNEILQNVTLFYFFKLITCKSIR